MKLGIAVPCYSGHIDKLWVLLDALNNQTLLPTKVVVSCSSTKSITAPTTYKYELLIVVSQSYKNASQNRNIAVYLLKDMDYISFIDADDIPHYQRNETLAGVIAIYGSDIILHNYMTSPEKLARPMTKFECNTKTLERSPYGHIKHIKPDKNINNKIHHSQANVKKSITDYCSI